jgi:large subunit ribosomal protein L30
VSSQLVIKLVRSGIGHPKKQKITLATLGLRRLGRTVVHNNTPQIRGMLRKVRHLVSVQTIEEETTKEGEK